jgi:glycyl-tRNA synthetase beta chain
VGILGIGHVPRSSKDPFGLRRAAQGVVRIALEGDMPVDLDLIAAKAFQGYGDQLELKGKELMAIWRPFIFDRVRHLLGVEGFAYDEIEAALEVGATNLPDLKARVEALHAVREEPNFLSVVLAAKRIANILRDSDEHMLSEELLTEDAERRLYNSFLDLKEEVQDAEEEGRYEHCFRAMAGFADVLDRFFVEVLVMDENIDLRNNRIAMLQSIQRTLSRTAELTAMVVERKGEEAGDA